MSCAKYDCIRHYNLNMFIDIVQHNLDCGWRCQGGMVTHQTPNDNAIWFYQAMIKEDECSVIKTVRSV